MTQRSVAVEAQDREQEKRRGSVPACATLSGLRSRVPVRGQLPSSLREKVLYQHVSIYLHAGMFVCLFVCGFVRPLYYFFQKANNVLYFCCASATQAMLV